MQKSFILRNQPETPKHRLFRLFHTLLNHYSIHPNLYYLILIIEILQLSYFACHSSFEHLWPSPLFKYIQIVLSFTDLSGIWRNAGSSALLVFTSLGMNVTI